MRVFLALAAAVGLAAAPCGWDDDPREAPSIPALLSSPQPIPSPAALLPSRPAAAWPAVTAPHQ
ncbi:hypothetical protein JHL17_13675 [Azospirillum sp. YIM B02556]|uniref:Uncharacterized protein n=1 Tax=Azospirillum endophyticum TaxID=2800326 RepID=A0ABS1F4W1_9PROT|nr:hypothetical protein [Azospirillum endophyticum]MBK1838464.1 hypothetical protein [Azospirillum endophyticum]